jgi:hypothetical protein
VACASVLSPACDATNRAAAGAAGLDPDLVAVLATRLGTDRTKIDQACALGAAWGAGRVSVDVDEAWELVASLPSGRPLPPGLRHTTAETLVQLVSESLHKLRIVAPFIDWLGLSFRGAWESPSDDARLRRRFPEASEHNAAVLKRAAERGFGT